MTVFFSNVDQAVQAISKKQIIVFPCDTIWGLLALAEPDTISRLAMMKDRATNKPFLVLIPSLDSLEMLVDHVPKSAYGLIRRYWPGPLTLIFKKHPDLPDYYAAGHATIAVRMPDFGPLNYLLNGVQQPVVSTSVNISQQSALMNFDDIDEEMLQKVDGVYRHEVPIFRKESTIVNCSGSSLALVREGAVAISPKDLC